jgi:multidrug efflux system membrane fusion protein
MTTVQPRKVEESPADGTQPKPQLRPEHHDGGRPGSSVADLHDAGYHAQPAKKRRWWIWALLLLIVLGGGTWFIVERTSLFQSSKEGAASKAQRPIPVVTSTVRQGDMNVYLSSLGTVTALQTDVIKTRVDGEVMDVFYTEGQMVKVGDPLVEIDPRPYQVAQAQAEGQLVRDKASLVQANQDLVRYQKLIVTNAISQQTLDAQVATVGQYEGAVKTDIATIDNAKLNITYCHITAPIAGRIGLRQIDKGNLVQAAAVTTLATITQLQPITVIYTIPQDDIYRVQQKFHSGEDVLVEAWNRDLAVKLAAGKLTAIDNLVDTTTGTVKLRATFPNEDNQLFPNEFVNAKTLIDIQRNVLIVPAGAVQRGPNGTFAYVVTADKNVEMRMLKVGQTEGDQTIIESGLNAGEVVVTEGTDRLMPGVTKVSIKDGKKGKGKKGADGASPSSDGKDATADASAAQSDSASADQPQSNSDQQSSTVGGPDATNGKALPSPPAEQAPSGQQTGSGRTRHHNQNGTKTQQ